MADLKKIGDLLVLLGALIGLIQGILLLIPGLGFTFGFVNVLGGFLDLCAKDHRLFRDL